MAEAASGGAPAGAVAAADAPDGWTASTYRRLAAAADLVSFEVRVRQTDLRVSAQAALAPEALDLVHEARAQIEAYLERDTRFLAALAPLDPLPHAPPVVRAMIEATRRAGVGPMAAVAGAIAEHVGRGLAARSPEIIVENGGDIFLRSRRRRELTVLAEHTALGGLRVAVPPVPEGAGIATSAGTVGHSLSFGRADAVMILAESGALADALATAIGNLVRHAGDLQHALATARRRGARAAVIIADGHLAASGGIELVG